MSGASSASSFLKQAAARVRRVVVRTVVGVTATVTALEVTTHLPSQGRSSAFYHHLSDDYVTPALRKAPLIDPETAHDAAIYLASKGWAPTHRASAIEQQCDTVVELQFTSPKEDNVKIHPLRCPNAIGLAAGFDKNGTVVQPMLDLGFGAVEVGTVTLQPQPGNPKPRMFRLTPDRAIINRYGFNSQGATAVQHNLQQYYNNKTHKQQQATEQDRNWLDTVWRFVFSSSPSSVGSNSGALGINIGKNKTTVALNDMIDDYTRLIAISGPQADYLVVNVSSPNTPDLRATLQNDTSNLTTLLTACLDARNKLAKNNNDNNSTTSVPPLFVKLAPDLSDAALLEIATIGMDCGIDGIVVTNTTNTRPATLLAEATLTQQAGGLSGPPVKDLSTTIIRKLYAATNGRLPIIGVGGVSSGRDAYEKLRAGASLVQLYSVLVYDGPGAVSRIRHQLAEHMLANGGHRKISDIVGLDHEDLYWQKRQARLQLQEQRFKDDYRREQTEMEKEQQQQQQQQPSAAAATTTEEVVSSTSSQAQQQQQQQT